MPGRASAEDGPCQAGVKHPPKHKRTGSGGRSAGDLWSHLCKTVAPALCELGVVSGQTVLDHRTHQHSQEPGLGGDQIGPGYSICRHVQESGQGTGQVGLGHNTCQLT